MKGWSLYSVILNLRVSVANLFFGERGGEAREPRDALAERGEARVVGLPAAVAVEDLLKHDGQLEDGEHLVEVHPRQVEPRARRVARGDLFTREPARAVGDGGDRVALRGGRDVNPVAEQYAEVNERVADGAHLPVEDGDDAPRVARVEHHVVELEVAVDERRT